MTTPEHGIEAVVAEAGARAIATADKILAHAKPADLESRLIDTVVEDLGLAVPAAQLDGRTPEPEVWETMTPTPSLGAREETRRLIPRRTGLRI